MKDMFSLITDEKSLVVKEWMVLIMGDIKSALVLAAFVDELNGWNDQHSTTKIVVSGEFDILYWKLMGGLTVDEIEESFNKILDKQILKPVEGEEFLYDFDIDSVRRSVGFTAAMATRSGDVPKKDRSKKKTDKENSSKETDEEKEDTTVGEEVEEEGDNSKKRSNAELKISFNESWNVYGRKTESKQSAYGYWKKLEPWDQREIEIHVKLYVKSFDEKTKEFQPSFRKYIKELLFRQDIKFPSGTTFHFDNNLTEFNFRKKYEKQIVEWLDSLGVRKAFIDELTTGFGKKEIDGKIDFFSKFMKDHASTTTGGNRWKRPEYALVAFLHENMTKTSDFTTECLNDIVIQKEENDE